MKRLLVLAVIVLSAGLANALVTPKPGLGGPRSDLAQEPTIRKLYAEFVKAWNKHDVKAMAAMWAPDGDHVEPDGSVAKGRPQVEKLLTAQHNTVFKGTTLQLTVETIWFVTQDVALIDGPYEVTGVRDPEGKEIPPRRGLLTAVLMRDADKWEVAASRLMIPTTLPYKKK